MNRTMSLRRGRGGRENRREEGITCFPGLHNHNEITGIFSIDHFVLANVLYLLLFFRIYIYINLQKITTKESIRGLRTHIDYINHELPCG